VMSWFLCWQSERVLHFINEKLVSVAINLNEQTVQVLGIHTSKPLLLAVVLTLRDGTKVWTKPVAIKAHQMSTGELSLRNVPTGLVCADISCVELYVVASHGNNRALLESDIDNMEAQAHDTAAEPKRKKKKTRGQGAGASQGHGHGHGWTDSAHVGDLFPAKQKVHKIPVHQVACFNSHHCGINLGLESIQMLLASPLSPQGLCVVNTISSLPAGTKITVATKNADFLGVVTDEDPRRITCVPLRGVLNSSNVGDAVASVEFEFRALPSKRKPSLSRLSQNENDDNEPEILCSSTVHSRFSVTDTRIPPSP